MTDTTTTLQAPLRPAAPRRADIDAGKMIGIFLVVLGHLFGRAPPAGGEWWYLVESYIYSFHMPFFVFLSGYVFTLREYHTRSLLDFSFFAKERAARLLVPFLLMAVIIVVGKVVVSRYAMVDSAPQGLLDGFWKILNVERESPVRFIWYVITIFYYSLVTPWVIKVVGMRPLVLISIGIVTLVMPHPAFLYLDNALRFYLFFLLGCLASQSVVYDRLVRSSGLWSIGAFVAASVAFLVFLYGRDAFFYARTSIFVMGSLACLAIPALCNRLTFLPDFMTRWSKYVFTIYLLNVASIGLVKGVLAKGIPFNADTMLIYAPFLLGGGLLIPIFFKAFVFSRVRWLDRMTS